MIVDTISIVLMMALLLALMPLDASGLLNRLTLWRLRRDMLVGERLTGRPDVAMAARRADVYLPPKGAHRPSGGWPVVVFFYGGSWRGRGGEQHAFVGRSLAARGMVVVVANERPVADMPHAEVLGNSAQTVAWAWRQARGWQANPGRVFVMGHGTGAAHAGMVALDARWLQPHQVHPQVLAGFIGVSGPLNFLPVGADHLPDAEAAALATVPPTWLFTAAADWFVSIARRTDALAFRLRCSGARVETRCLPWSSHTTLLAALAAPLSGLSSVTDDVCAIVTGEAQAGPAPFTHLMQPTQGLASDCVPALQAPATHTEA